MAQPPSYEASQNPGYQAPVYPPQDGAYPPQNGAYPPQNGAYPPPNTGMAYPPPTQGYQPVPADQQQPYVYPGKQEPGVDVEYQGHSDDTDKQTMGIISFDDKSIRLSFIRKVFSILILQMSVTLAFIAWFIFHEPTKGFVQNHVGMYIAGCVLFVVLYFVLVCCTSVARRHPINLVLLAIFTISLSYMVAVISSFHDTKIVLALFGMTLLISVGIIGFASQTKYDFTKWAGVLFVCCFALFIFGLFAAILIPTGAMQGVRMVYAGLGALLFMAFLAFDTQLIMGGKKYEISPEDYVFAAMMLYVDIIYIFLYLLALFGGNN